jgi:hypothetical protein
MNRANKTEWRVLPVFILILMCGNELRAQAQVPDQRPLRPVVQLMGGSYVSAGGAYKNTAEALLGVGVGITNPAFLLTLKYRYVFLKDALVRPRIGVSSIVATDISTFPVSVGISLGADYLLRQKYRLFAELPLYYELLETQKFFLKFAIGVQL